MNRVGPRRPGCWRDQRGVSALEFAMLFPLLLLLILGTVEIAFVMMIDASLELAVRDASRYGMISPATAAETRDQRIRDIVENWLGRWLSDPQDIAIDVRTYAAFDNIGEPEPFADDNGNGTWDAGEDYQDLNDDGVWNADMGTAGAGGREEIVLYDVSFTRPTVTGILTMVGIDAYRFDRRIVIQNE